MKYLLICLFIFSLAFSFTVFPKSVHAIPIGVPAPLLEEAEAGIDKARLSPVGCSVDALPECIRDFYKFAVGAVIVLAVVVLAWGGFAWLTSGGNVSQIENAKGWISGSILGLVLAVTSFVILNTINPQLTLLKLNVPGINPVNTETVLCTYTDSSDEEHVCVEFHMSIVGEDCNELSSSYTKVRVCAGKIITYEWARAGLCTGSKTASDHLCEESEKPDDDGFTYRCCKLVQEVGE